MPSCIGCPMCENRIYNDLLLRFFFERVAPPELDWNWRTYATLLWLWVPRFPNGPSFPCCNLSWQSIKGKLLLPRPQANKKTLFSQPHSSFIIPKQFVAARKAREMRHKSSHSSCLPPSIIGILWRHCTAHPWNDTYIETLRMEQCNRNCTEVGEVSLNSRELLRVSNLTCGLFASLRRGVGSRHRFRFGGYPVQPFPA